jgi:hypothetical protein
LVETSIFILWFYVAALLRLCDVKLRDNYTVFVCSIVVPYLVFLCWAALASFPDKECNKLAGSKANTAWQIIVGNVFAAMTVMSIATASETHDQQSKKITTTFGAHVVAEKVDDEAKAIDEDNAIFPVTIPTLIF